MRSVCGEILGHAQREVLTMKRAFHETISLAREFSAHFPRSKRNHKRKHDEKSFNSIEVTTKTNDNNPPAALRGKVRRQMLLMEVFTMKNV